MADFYAEMRQVAIEMLAPTSEGGLGQGSIELVRYLDGDAPTNPWDPPLPPERDIIVLDGVGKELIGAPVENGGQIVATDLQVIVAPWGGTVEPADVLEIDSSPVTILKIENIPAAGPACAIRFVVRL